MLDNNESKMKIKELRRVIHEQIKNAIKEATYIGQGSIDSLKKDPKYSSLSADAKKTAEDDIKTGNAVKLGEMARLSIGYKLADPNMDTEPYANKMVSRISVKSILDYVKENPGVTEKDIQTQFNFVRPQIANQLSRTLREMGIFVPFTHGGVELSADNTKSNPLEPSKTLSNWKDKEDMFVGPYFDDEEFVRYGSDDKATEPEEEPENIPIDNKTNVSSLDNAKNRATEFFIDDSNDRLLKKLIASWNATKLRLKEIDNEDGGLSSSDFKKSEKNRKEKAIEDLPELITRYVDRIKAIEDEETIKEIVRILAKKLASVGFNGLTKRIAKQLGVEIPKEEEKVDENAIFERLQILANIKQK